MSALLEQVEQTIQTRRLFEPGQRILVAVSGGLDSMVLLSVLHELARSQRWQLRIAHFNHQLRGRSSNADERLVRRTAQRLVLPISIGLADVRAAARAGKISIEMAARDLRHAFLARIARKYSCPTIALAHHADDQVELFFLRLLRGSGPEGLAGMKWRAASPADDNVTLVRPFLDQSKTALWHYAREHKVKFREDASNASVDVLRNRLRHELLPLLRSKYQPRLNDIALRVMDLVGAEAEVVNQAAKDWIARRIDRFDGLPPGIQRQILRLQLLQHGLLADYDLIERLRRFSDRRVSISPAATATRSGLGDASPSAELLCYRNPAGIVHVETPTAFKPESLEVYLSTHSGQAAFAELKLNWRILQGPGEVPRPMPRREVFDADRVGERIVLRHWQPGDRFQPIGLPKPAKLQDLFTNAKIPRARRRRLIVAATVEGEVFWVQGLRISERFKLTRSTKRRLQWRW